ncbi:MAG TPA: peptide-methionine (S)-S-oxide reductase [Mucilaginibacter sp.]|jgi:peptide methionine sulfoxide reductase msrA/msrB
MEKVIVFGGGRFWCTHAIFQQLRGVSYVTRGYSEDKFQHSGSRDKTDGQAGRVKVIRVIYNPEVISLADIIRIHLRTHNPTIKLDLHDDASSQYRSVIFYEDEIDRATIVSVIAEMQMFYEHLIATKVKHLVSFESALDEDQDCY